MVYSSVDTLDFSLDEIPAMPLPRRVLMTTPAHFDIQYVINPHMEDYVGAVDREAALEQWNAVQAAYTAIGFSPDILVGRAGLPDMVFCANQSLPFLEPETGKPGIILSRMHADERKQEVPYYSDHFGIQKYRILNLVLPESASFEGTGDAIWHPGKALLWGGYGFRTNTAAYDLIDDVLRVPIIILELKDPDFYHLDTCFCALDAETVLICASAFTEEALALIRAIFPRVIEAPDHEARNGFACNAHSPDGKHVIIHDTCETTMTMLTDMGYIPIAVDTSEFIKAGGSVFCMKLMHW